MSSFRKSATTGHLLKAAPGRLTKCAECPDCGGLCDTDGDCSGDEPGCPDAECCTPSRYEIVLSGFDSSACTTCFACRGDDDFDWWGAAKLHSLSVDGSYTLPFSGSASWGCVWSLPSPSIGAHPAGGGYFSGNFGSWSGYSIEKDPAAWGSPVVHPGAFCDESDDDVYLDATTTADSLYLQLIKWDIGATYAAPDEAATTEYAFGLRMELAGLVDGLHWSQYWRSAQLLSFCTDTTACSSVFSGGRQVGQLGSPVNTDSFVAPGGLSNRCNEGAHVLTYADWNAKGCDCLYNDRPTTTNPGDGRIKAYATGGTATITACG